MKNTFTKILVLAFAVFASIQLFAINQIDGNWEEYGLTSEYNGYYVIATAEDLETFRSMGDYDNIHNGVVVADITINESVLDENGELRSDWEKWVQNRWKSSSPLNGTFDGRNHVISGLYIASDATYVGLFSQMYNGSVVKNVYIEDSYFKGKLAVGGICGSKSSNSDTIKISNCSVNAYIQATQEMVGGVYGGYDPYGSNRGIIEDCVNTGIIVSGGGIAGGICSQWSGTINYCVNKGEVIGKGDYVGGIVGKGIPQRLSYSDINFCYNVGTISGYRYVGGIAGTGYSIKESCNMGEVTGVTYIGGLAGDVSNLLSNVFNTGTISADAGYVGGLAGNAKDVSYAYNAGVVSNNSYLNYIGGLCGTCSGTMISCYYDSDVCPFKAVNNSTYAGATAKTTSAMCSTTLLTGFSSDIWAAGTPDVSGSVIPKDDEFATKTIGRYPRLKFIDPYTFVPYAREIYYNIGTSSMPEWESCEQIFSIQDLEKMTLSPTATFVLMNDITEYRNLSDGELLETPIVLWNPINNFQGKLYGRGKTISGLCKTSTTGKGGLFGKIQNATISDVTISKCVFKGDTVGAIAAFAFDKVLISNCNNYCDFDISNAKIIGGICGKVGPPNVSTTTTNTIKNCNNYGEINGNNSEKCGGICGASLQPLDILNCMNMGNVVGNYVGGIIGYSVYQGNIDMCINKGDIYSSTGTVGGLVGYSNGSSDLKYSLNVGNLYNSGAGFTCGICGEDKGNTKYSQCLNLGSILSVATASAISNRGTFNYNYYNSDICAYKAVANVDDGRNYGMTTAELVDGTLPPNFDSEYWAIRPAEIRDMKKYYYYPYIKCYGQDSAILAIVRDCHSVTMNFNGVTTTDDIVSFYEETEESQLPHNVVKEGCTFDGWYDNSNYTSSVYTKISATERTDMNFYAKWIANNYDITYELGGGTINSGKNTSYTYGYGVLLPTDVTRTGYTFKGWYDNSNFDGESVLSIPANATGNKTYYAHWVVNTYHVTFFAYEGVMNTDIDSYTFGKTTILPTEVTKSGYDFAGWYTNDSYSGVAIQSIASNETGDKMYYAKWNKKSSPVSVTFDRAMGSVSGIDSYLHGDNAV
ncbi:MAG: InlB B-repeat-containing protein, partial [Bacteroidales bacterium]|nr:InlB B-repeat-containing protein [Bacteroidales bacterium]